MEITTDTVLMWSLYKTGGVWVAAIQCIIAGPQATGNRQLKVTAQSGCAMSL